MPQSPAIQPPPPPVFLFGFENTSQYWNVPLPHLHLQLKKIPPAWHMPVDRAASPSLPPSLLHLNPSATTFDFVRTKK
ncbi:hypothetical protein M407DRAFT_107154 [Tulasnella calospora MUT 4182]|uniref:Uncharacterized protein n=1 Tax=Tulasnella calospora MUT 4182 TaxID=1051891 RepID=A0A0C3KQP2_9AGAM|nr:hypothetical protein M407DRAFT_107154 [Tulasnella calospora MUT 4182]